jgi:hypothetical protein
MRNEVIYSILLQLQKKQLLMQQRLKEILKAYAVGPGGNNNLK